jgi:hypothetical protein
MASIKRFAIRVPSSPIVIAAIGDRQDTPHCSKNRTGATNIGYDTVAGDGCD